LYVLDLIWEQSNALTTVKGQLVCVQKAKYDINYTMMWYSQYLVPVLEARRTTGTCTSMILSLYLYHLVACSHIEMLPALTLNIYRYPLERLIVEH
jgi:hypothetical protein